jgi:hypothetical protein
MRINKSVKYLNKFKWKIVKHLDNSVSVYRLKKSAENLNCRDNSDYCYFVDFSSMNIATTYIKNLKDR